MKGRCWMLISSVLLLLAACGGPDSFKGDPSIGLATPRISHETLVSFFSMGHSLDYLPFGGIGSIDGGGPDWSASIEFVDVPEGGYVTRYDGYGLITLDVAGVGLVQGYCHLEKGVGQLNVVSGGRNDAEVSVSPNPGPNHHIGVDRFLANPNYQFDPQHPWAGSPDGENIITIYADGLEPLVDLDFRVCDPARGQDPAASPFGIFPDLPAPPDTAWPDPADWERQAMLIPTESQGDLVGYLVVMPGAKPTCWEVRFVDEEGNVEILQLRVSNTNTITISAP